MIVEIAPLGNLESVRRDWQTLQQKSSCGFFQSWTWIGSLLAVSSASFLVARARSGDRLVGLGILGRHEAVRRRVIRSRQILLHETGNQDLDRIYIEHNGFVIDPDYEAKAAAALFDALQRQGDWDELVLSGVSADMVAAAAACGLNVVTDKVIPSFAVDLASLREQGDWTSVLSKNTASQLAQARRYAERDGPITLKAAGSFGEALRFFEELRVLHDARWHARGQVGAFSSPPVLAFHQALITAGFPLGEIELLRAAAGQTLLGYLYNFRFRNRVSNYQSGFYFGTDNRHRPGLVMHAAAIARALQEGAEIYDFLAGETRLKTSLGRNVGDMIWCRAQMPRWSLIAERFASRLKQRAREK